MSVDIARIHRVLEQQHRAIDTLMAMIISMAQPGPKGIMSVDIARIHRVLEQQHRAIDTLVAMIISMEPIDKADRFMPTTSGHIWEAVVAGNQLIKDLEPITGLASS